MIFLSKSSTYSVYIYINIKFIYSLSLFLHQDFTPQVVSAPEVFHSAFHFHLIKLIHDWSAVFHQTIRKNVVRQIGFIIFPLFSGWKRKKQKKTCEETTKPNWPDMQMCWSKLGGKNYVARWFPYVWGFSFLPFAPGRWASLGIMGWKVIVWHIVGVWSLDMKFIWTLWKNHRPTDYLEEKYGTKNKAWKHHPIQLSFTFAWMSPDITPHSNLDKWLIGFDSFKSCLAAFQSRRVESHVGQTMNSCNSKQLLQYFLVWKINWNQMVSIEFKHAQIAGLKV